MTIRAITFDLDNTLWETDQSVFRAEDTMRDALCDAASHWMHSYSFEALKTHRQQVATEYPDKAHDLGWTRREALRRWFLSQGANGAMAQELAELGFNVFYRERQKVEPYPGVDTMLSQLAARFPLGAITNGNADLMTMPMGRYFQFSFRAHEFPRAKPAPDMFTAALAHFQIAPHELLHVGDDPDHDVLGAASLGIRTAWVNTRALPTEGAPEADLTLNSVVELIDHLTPRD